MAEAIVELVPRNDEETESPEWWRDRLVRRLLGERPANLARVDWYLGRQPLPEVPRKYKDAYKLLLDMSRNAWPRLVIDSISERVRLSGVRLDGTDADLEIWNLLKVNHIDIDQRLVHSEALTLSKSYYSLWPNDEGGVSIVPESGLQVTHEPDPTDRRAILAAVKFWEDTIDSTLYVNVFLSDLVVKWKADMPSTWTDERGVSQTKQATDLEWEEIDRIDHEYGMPIVAFSNRPTLFAGAQSEIDDLIPVFRRIDKYTLDLLLTAEAGAFRQKWATGLQVPVDPETKKPVEPYEAAVTKLWVGGKDAQFGSFDSSELAPYLTAIDQAVAQISAVSRVPSYYLVSPNLVNPPSADTMVAAEAGLIHKATSLMDYWGEEYETMTRLALRMAGDDRADAPGLEMVWTNPAMPSEAVQADAAVKWASLGVPEEVLWEKGGATPEEVARWKIINARQALTAAVLRPVVTVDDAEETGAADPEEASAETSTEPPETGAEDEGGG